MTFVLLGGQSRPRLYTPPIGSRNTESHCHSDVWGHLGMFLFLKKNMIFVYIEHKITPNDNK